MSRKQPKLEGMLNSPIFIKKEQERLNIQTEVKQIPLNEIMGYEKKEEEFNFETEQIKHENESLKTEIAELKEKLDKVSGPKKALQEKYDQLEKEYGELKSLFEKSSKEVKNDTNS